jgi:hypothetical protein
MADPSVAGCTRIGGNFDPAGCRGGRKLRSGDRPTAWLLWRRRRPCPYRISRRRVVPPVVAMPIASGLRGAAFAAGMAAGHAGKYPEPCDDPAAHIRWRAAHDRSHRISANSFQPSAPETAKATVSRGFRLSSVRWRPQCASEPEPLSDTAAAAGIGAPSSSICTSSLRAMNV